MDRRSLICNATQQVFGVSCLISINRKVQTLEKPQLNNSRVMVKLLEGSWGFMTRAHINFVPPGDI